MDGSGELIRDLATGWRVEQARADKARAVIAARAAVLLGRDVEYAEAFGELREALEAMARYEARLERARPDEADEAAMSYDLGAVRVTYGKRPERVVSARFRSFAEVLEHDPDLALQLVLTTRRGDAPAVRITSRDVEAMLGDALPLAEAADEETAA